MTTRVLMNVALFGLAALASSAASAHVTLEQREAPIGAPYKAKFRVPHGCGNSPTVKVRVRIPDGVVDVKPMPKAGWQIDTVNTKYDKPYKMLQTTVTEGIREVTWSRLSDKNYDEFVVSLYLTDDLVPGRMLYFPVVQECEKGVHRWIEIPKDGKSADLPEPAPGLKLIPAKRH